MSNILIADDNTSISSILSEYAKQIAERHQARLTVESELNHGTTFKFEIATIEEN